MSCIQTASTSSQLTPCSVADAPVGEFGRIGAKVRVLVHQIVDWIDRCRQRGALAELDQRLLDDIGVSREAAAREAAKPFWRV